MSTKAEALRLMLTAIAAMCEAGYTQEDVAELAREVWDHLEGGGQQPHAFGRCVNCGRFIIGGKHTNGQSSSGSHAPSAASPGRDADSRKLQPSGHTRVHAPSRLVEPSAADCATQAGPATVIIDVTVQPKPPCPIPNRRSSMTTAKPTATTPRPPDGFRFEDPPERQPDAMTSFNHLTITGSAHYLLEHFGNRETTLVAGEHYVSREPVRSTAGLHYPDLLVAFAVDPEVYHRRNAYVISEQGKPPDFVLEIASRSTGQVDVHEKREHYAELGIPEYWRFDETGEFHGTKLAGDRLVDNIYVPVTIEELPGGVLQGYSAVLNLHLRWEQGQLAWYDPATGNPILTYQDQHGRADAEREARVRAEARVQELEAELRRLQNP